MDQFVGEDVGIVGVEFVQNHQGFRGYGEAGLCGAASIDMGVADPAEDPWHKQYVGRAPQCLAAAEYLRVDLPGLRKQGHPLVRHVIAKAHV